MFDRSKTVVLKGTLKEYRFVAPHSWISVIATADADPARHAYAEFMPVVLAWFFGNKDR